MKDIFLHIGMPRTGTTFLQQDIFPEIKKLHVVNLRRKDGIKFKMVSMPNTREILTNIEKYDSNLIISELSKYYDLDKTNLITDENIYDNLWSKEDKRFLKLKKLKSVFPEAKIIFGTREKRSLLPSLYKKYVMDGGILTFKEFKKSINIDKLDYKPYIDLLHELFGKNRVYIYKFEDIRKDVYSFVEELCNFMNVSIPKFKNVRRNVGYSLWQIKFALIANHLFKTPFNPGGYIPMRYDWIPYRVVFQSPYFPKFLRGKEASLEDLE